MLAALAWWTFLLLKFNATNYALAKSSNMQQISNDVIEEFNRNKNMIVSEGIVFAVALVIGVYLLYRSYKRELATTHRQNNFLMSVTHELKTPLSVMKLSNETMRKRDLNKKLQNKLLEIDKKEINRLELLINNLLLSSKLDQKHAPQEENLSELLIARSDVFNSRFPNRIKHDIYPKVIFPIDKNLFTIAIDNLIDNALRYSENQVLVELKNNQERIDIRITDTGMGIPIHERKNVFEKFYRIGNEDTRTTQGTGLGLYLTQAIVDAHDGNITISDNTPQGTIFTLSLNRK